MERQKFDFNQTNCFTTIQIKNHQINLIKNSHL